jgi:hypothetical protein
MTTDVADRTDVSADAKDETLVETKGQADDTLLTDDTATSLQTGTESEEDVHAAELAAEAKAAHDAEVRQEARLLAVEEAKAAKIAKDEADRKTRVKEQRVNSVKAVDAAFLTLATQFQLVNRQTGEEVTLNDADRKLFVDPVEQISLVAEQAEQARESARIRGEIDSLFPDDTKQAAFWKDVEVKLGAPIDDTKALPIAPILAALLEAKAEDAPTIVKLKAEHAKALKAEYDKGKAETLRLLDEGKLQRDSGTGTGSGGGGAVTWAQIQKMSPAQVNAIPGDVYLAALEKG